MTGAEHLVETAIAAGVEVCFANPGTTEMPLVAALDRVPGIRAVLGLVCANRLYRILQMEAARSGAKELARNARMLTELAPPALDWVALARGFGVPGARATTADELVIELRRALATEGPNLIEMVL